MRFGANMNDPHKSIDLNGWKTKRYLVQMEWNSVVVAGQSRVVRSIPFRPKIEKKKTKSVEKRRTGRPRRFTEHEERWIVRKITYNPKTGAVKLTLKAQQRFNKSANSETVRNILRKYNFHGRVARRKPFLSKAHRRARLEFAKSCIKKPPEFWNSVLFVDESKYNFFESDGKQMVWRKPNSEVEMKSLTSSGGGSQMVWSCMSAVGVGNLRFIDGMMDGSVLIL
ncbi:hypothetical protein AVEN_101633-2 [Araneus ventricosus]|uniref:Transposase Tc1-like domain-containing protein n=1 Tax=Araneus ventricosus TaxID=182803 RepID=A0A4Y2EWR3_ARAVE|nr:hypothetical protein AVEN_101633-2 [Araneus ventricosus]